MVIKIVMKKGGLSNEPQTLPESTSVKNATTIPSGIPNADQLIPFIDRISVVLKVPTLEDAKAIYSEAFVQFKDSEVFTKGKGGVWGLYKTARRVALACIDNPKKWPLLQYAYDATEKRAIEFRTEFSPVDLGVEGLTQFHAQLISLMPGGWQYFVEHGRITMVEVTVDVPNVEVESFHLLPPQGPSAMTWKVNGKLETMVLGKSKGNQTKIYDRGKKRIAKKQGWAGPPTTRIERRLRPGQPMSFAQLSTMPNPFANIQMIVPTVGCPPTIPKSREYVWTFFLDSAKVRGLSPALKLLPEERRTEYRKWLGKHPVSWWQPDAIWAHWPSVVEKLSIASSAWM